jgi:hypothetical protein
MSEQDRTVTLAGVALQRSCHACAFFHNIEEEYEILLPFVKEGLERNDRSLHIVATDKRSEWIERLRQAEIDVDNQDRVEVRTWDEAYLRTGRFDQQDMLSLIQDVLAVSRKRGYGMTRFWANMEWALEERPGVEDLVDYESRLNEVLPDSGDVVVCTYDLNRFDASVIMDVLRIHPMVILGGYIQENPFYIEPAQFLKEFRQRKRAS